MKLGIVVSYKILIQNFEGATILGHLINDVTVYTSEKFCLQKRSQYTPLESKIYAN